MFEGKSVLVTGGTGMIGVPLVKKLLERGAFVVVASLDTEQKRKISGAYYYNGDLTQFHECAQVCRGKNYVFHLAGVKGSPKMCAEQPADFFVPLLQMNTNMMEAARTAGVKKYLFTRYGLNILKRHLRKDRSNLWGLILFNLFALS